MSDTGSHTLLLNLVTRNHLDHVLLSDVSLNWFKEQCSKITKDDLDNNMREPIIFEWGSMHLRTRVTPIEYILKKALDSKLRDLDKFNERAAKVIRLLNEFCGVSVESVASDHELRSPLGKTLFFPQSLHCMQALLECGARFNEQDRRRCPLLYISRQGDSHYEMLKLLAAYNEKQLDLDARREVDPVSGNGVLHECVNKLFIDYSYPFKIPDMILIFIRYFGADPSMQSRGHILSTAIDLFYAFTRRERCRSGEEYNHFKEGQAFQDIPFEVWWRTVEKTREILLFYPRFVSVALPIAKRYTPLLTDEQKRRHISSLGPEHIGLILRSLGKEYTEDLDKEIADLLRPLSI